jgi:DNA-binding response OmpR family regulator
MAALIGAAPLDARIRSVSSQDDALAQFIRRPADPYRLAETPDVLVMDHDLSDSLQESDQKPFLARLQELHITQQALVMIVTPSITMTQKIRAFQLGASHVLVEPLSPQSFWLTLRLLLRFRELAPLISWRAVATDGHGH